MHHRAGRTGRSLERGKFRGLACMLRKWRDADMSKSSSKGLVEAAAEWIFVPYYYLATQWNELLSHPTEGTH